MKYTNTNTPIQCFLTNNPCYKGTKPMEVKGVLWHSTGANNKNVKRYVQPSKDNPKYDELIALLGKNQYNNSWNNTTRKVGMNAFIGAIASGEVETVQTMPWDWRPWGCGSGSKGSCNNGWIQFEICEDGLTDKTYFNKVYKEACELTAYMCKMFHLDPLGTTKNGSVTVPVIICHADSNRLGLGSNHGDVLHWFKKHSKTMEDVRNDVWKLMNEGSPVVSVPAPAPEINTSSSLSGATNEEKVWNFLLSEIKNEFGVAGLMGNLNAESSFKPSNLQGSYEKSLGFTDETYTTAVDNGTYTKDQFINDKAGYGLAQWTYWSRKQSLYEYVKEEQKRSIGDLQGQLEFLCKELKTYKTVWNTLLNAINVFDASQKVLLNYEKPASMNNESTQHNRAAYGEAIYQKYAKNKVVETPTELAPTVNASSVRMGHASISENNSANGTAGDSTTKEVCERKWYNRPWGFIAIHPDAGVRERMALAVEAGCANDKIGYSQSGRNTLNAQAKLVGYDLSKISITCNADCASFMNVCAVASGAPDATYGSNGWTTSSMKTKLQKAGYKIVDDSVLVADAKYCVRGAIYVNPSAHTACGLDNGEEYFKTLVAAGVETTGEVKQNTEYVGKGVGTAKALSTMNIREKTDTSSYSYGVIKPGVEIEVLEVLNNGWYKVVWTWAKEGYAYSSNTTGKYYEYTPKAVETIPTPTAPTVVKKTISATQHSKSKDTSLKGQYVVDASSVNVRDGAGLDQKVLTTIPRGTLVNNYGYYTEVDGTKWLFVKFVYEKTTYTAFISNRYLKKVG